MALTPEQEQRLRMLQLTAKAKAAPEPEAPKPTAGQRLREGFKGAAEAFEVEDDESLAEYLLNLPEKGLEAVGGNIIPAAGDVGMDAMGSAYRSLPSQLRGAIEEPLVAAGEYISESPVGQAARNIWFGAQNQPNIMAARKAVGEFAQTPYGEEAIDRAQQVANVASIGVPAPGAAQRAADYIPDALRSQVVAAERMDVQRRLQPPNINDPKVPGRVEEVGMLNTQKYVPTEIEQRQYGRAAELPDFNPDRSARHNINVINDEVSRLAEDLDRKLSGPGAQPISAADVRADLEAIVQAGADSPALVGNPGEVASRIYQKFEQIIDELADANGNLTPRQLLQARRDLDKWVDDEVGNKLFNPDVNTARSVVADNLRRSINQRVAAASPVSVDVADELQRQSDLLRSRERLQPEAMAEAGNSISRGVQRIEEDTGLAPPRTPVAMKTNLTDIAAGVIAGTLTLTSLLRKGAVRKGKQLTANAINAATKAASAGNRVALVEILNDDESYEDAD